MRSSRSASNTTARPTLANAQGAGWADHDVVFASANGAALDSAKVRRSLRNITAAGGLDPDAWTPRELRHSCVSLLSDEGVPIEQIARLVAHVGGSKVTEAVYRKQLRPVIDEGATAMNRVFPVVHGRSCSVSTATAVAACRGMLTFVGR